ncbi:MAG: ATP-binding cassette domain-containing protein, partial [Anaerolineae bacterium]|nr:ATP-binding cassette domain-containing protein [Anaerolineae bacterium]NIN97711.1 ATP-binding cassette domain-containing protein [Anaerolineae bacterium]NIQ80698.1 ATP-binding cassette domain-containing protein [Anaerolineae bacterium]
MLELRGVDVFYGDLRALHGVSLSVKGGEIVSIVGANAAGKSTILKVISGLMTPSSGE